MRSAARLLTSTSLEVTEVAHRVGFQTPSAFSRAFRGHHGLSPTDFRRQAEQPPSA